MRIGLLCLSYPPNDTEGIARQRQILARALAEMGHDVSVLTLGHRRRTRLDHKVRIYESPVITGPAYSERLPGLNTVIAESEALYASVREAEQEGSFDILDAPLWRAQGFVTLHRRKGPAVISLQTTRAQLLNIKGESPDELDRAIQHLEQRCLIKADGWLADSQSMLDEISHEHGLMPPPTTRVVHHGIEPRLSTLPTGQAKDSFVALVVGRLEERKGTRLLFRALPPLLRKQPSLSVRFIGRDNSSEDGWRQKTGTTYPEYFQSRYPDVSPQVKFEGYVDDATLAYAYEEADLVLAPSLYESFGLVYLEAMRAAKPVVALRAGAATEIFADEADDGAILCPPNDPSSLGAAIERLTTSPELSRKIGANGHRRQVNSFTAQGMAVRSLDLYRSCMRQPPSDDANSRAIYQVMEALDYGDGVSNIARANASILEELALPKTILARYAHSAVAHETSPLAQALISRQCSLIFHYWGYNTSTWLASAVSGPNAFYYHNITPPHFFDANTEAHKGTSRGYAQIAEIVEQFDLLIGDSNYNVDQLRPYLKSRKPALCIYPIAEQQDIASLPHDPALVSRIKSSGSVHLVFVGRIARNKRQDLLLKLFEYYYDQIDHGTHLWLVGNEHLDPVYRRELQEQHRRLSGKDNVHFVGKVSDREVASYMLAASAFVCASEHEGFCIPIAHAMALGIPVIAKAAAAVPETLGGSGILVSEWNSPKTAELINVVLKDPELRARLVEGQQVALKRFSRHEARSRLKAGVDFLRQGVASSPHFRMIEPASLPILPG